MDNMVSEDALAMIGVEKVRQYDVTERDIKRFSQAIGETNPLHFDEDYAKSTKYGAIVAPPLVCQMFTFEDVPTDRLPSDGSPIEIDVPVPAQRTVGGGSSYEIFHRVRAGDQITAKSTLRDVFAKDGRSGRLYFVVVETDFFNQKQERVAKETATYIKRVNASPAVLSHRGAATVDKAWLDLAAEHGRTLPTWGLQPGDYRQREV